VGHQAYPAWDRRLSPAWQRSLTFFLVTLGWVFFRAETFGHAGQWFASLAGLHGLFPPWTRETLSLAALVVLGLAVTRLCPNSLELPLGRLGRLPQVGLATATAVAVVLMNYGSKFLYFQF
jgi:alginate O-acetyltransferase complex protein AlgI